MLDTQIEPLQWGFAEGGGCTRTHCKWLALPPTQGRT